MIRCRSQNPEGGLGHARAIQAGDLDAAVSEAEKEFAAGAVLTLGANDGADIPDDKTDRWS
jgi:hypothetical protein